MTPHKESKEMSSGIDYALAGLYRRYSITDSARPSIAKPVLNTKKKKNSCFFLCIGIKTLKHHKGHKSIKVVHMTTIWHYIPSLVL